MQDVLLVDIYLCKNKVTGHMYIGQAKQVRHGRPFGTAKRAKEHVYEALRRGRAGCRALNNAICKYGPTAFDWITLQTVLAEQADAAEVQTTAAYGTFESPDHYNLTPGGQGYSITAAQREKQALKMRKHQQDRSIGIAVLDNAQHRGYRVKDPVTGSTYSFLSPALTMDAKLILAEDCMKQCREAHAHGLPLPPRRTAGFPKSDPTLPNGVIQYNTNGRKALMFKKKGYTTKRFMAGTPAEQRAKAQAHVDQLGLSHHSNATISGRNCCH
jgi:hypothetical protein